MVGFSEETIFRGFIQNRLIARFGTLRGLVGTSFFFALYHLPLLYILYSDDILGSLLGALLRFSLA
jgi:membrane protease YdiL (CAAX protease family)